MRKPIKASPAGILAATIAGVPLGTPVAKPASKRAAKRAAIAASKPTGDAAPAVKPAKPTAVRFGPFSGGNVNRTATTVAAKRTAFGGVTSNRDEAYLALYATVANASDDGSRAVTLAKLAERGSNPFYAFSNKPHDAGAINRARKAGNLTVSDDGATITLTEAGEALARNVLAKLGKPAPSAS